MDGLVSDDLVSSLLLLHGLHPVDLRTRVQQALDKARPFLYDHGSQVELLGEVVDTVACLETVFAGLRLGEP